MLREGLVCGLQIELLHGDCAKVRYLCILKQDMLPFYSFSKKSAVRQIYITSNSWNSAGSPCEILLVLAKQFFIFLKMLEMFYLGNSKCVSNFVVDTSGNILR